MTATRLASLVLLLVVALRPAPATAETAAWNGFRALGVPDQQLALLAYVTTNALDDGGLVDNVIDDSKVALRCAADIGCQCAALRAQGVRYGAFGNVGRLGDLWTVELTLVDAHSCTVASSGYLNESLADAEVAPRLAALARQLATPATDLAATATAAGVAREIDATPALVTTLTRSQIRALHLRNLDEVFPLVPGFDVVDANWGGVILNQGLPSTLLFLADGVPLVNGLNGFRSLGRDFRSSLAHVDRIEFVRGPGAVLWGQNAFLGVVNLIAETPTRRQPAVDAGVTVGTQDTEEVWVRGAQNRGAYAFSASVDVGRRVGISTAVPDSPYAVVGVPAPYTFGNGGTTHPAADLWLDAHVRLAIHDRLELTAENLTSDIEFEISPRGPLLERGRGGHWKKTHRIYALTGTQPVYDEPGAKVTLRGTASRYELYSWESFAFQPRWPDGPAPGPTDPRDLRLGLRSVQGNDRPRVAHQIDARMIHDFTRPAFENHLTAGIGVLHQHTPDSLASLVPIDVDPATPVVSFGEKDFVTLSSFAFDELAPRPWLVLNAGARVQVDKPYQSGESWRATARFQGGAAVRRGGVGAKLIYAEGFRPPDAVALFSQVGTNGNPELVPELSRDLAALVSAEVVEGLTLRSGASVTRISGLILLDPIVGDPTFLYTPVNRGTIDLASGFIEGQLTSRWVDGFASWHVKGMRESDPLGTGIPLARHTAALAMIWRPLPDLSLFVRGTFASPRRVRVATASNPAASVRTDPTIRSAVGLTLSDVVGDADFELTIDNPLLLEHDAPYQLDGAPAGLIERRTGTELFATIRYDR